MSQRNIDPNHYHELYNLPKSPAPVSNKHTDDNRMILYTGLGIVAVIGALYLFNRSLNDRNSELLAMNKDTHAKLLLELKERQNYVKVLTGAIEKSNDLGEDLGRFLKGTPKPDDSPNSDSHKTNNDDNQ